MTEKRWVSYVDPKAMLARLGDKANDRKSRLFAVACCRQLQPRSIDERLEHLLAVAEDVADGQESVQSETFRKAQHGAFDVLNARNVGSAPRDIAKAVITTAFHAWALVFAEAAIEQVRDAKSSQDGTTRSSEKRTQAAILREIFGNPFRPITFDPAWRTSDVMLLANGIYAEKAFDRMPILADALQDAGCDSDALLGHLRDPHATHVRGCWALDLVLGKE